jgi:transcriptional regulator
MSKEKQILQLRIKGYSQRRIADTLKVSRNTVAKVFKALQEHPVSEDSLNTLRSGTAPAAIPGGITSTGSCHS